MRSDLSALLIIEQRDQRRVLALSSEVVETTAKTEVTLFSPPGSVGVTDDPVARSCSIWFFFVAPADK